MASESLILTMNSDHLDPGALRTSVEQTEDPYLAKNYALLHSSMSSEAEVMRAQLELPDILNEALEYARVEPDFTALHRLEPDVLRNTFYESKYPDGPEEFENFIS